MIISSATSPASPAIEPDFESFFERYSADNASVLWTSLPADIETPVSVFLKLAKDRPYSFLLESAVGGQVRGRYSFIGLEPDLIWRCTGAKAEINRFARNSIDHFEPCAEAPLQSLRALLKESYIDTPVGLPPMAAGIFGFAGYEMIRHVENLPEPKSSPIMVPDSVFVRPSIIAIFDSVLERITIVTPVWPNSRLGAAAYDQASSRLRQAVQDLRRGLISEEPTSQALDLASPVANMPTANFTNMVEKARDYILAGDIFQVVLAQRFSMPFTLPAFSLYRSLRRINPSPFLYYLNYGDFQVVGSSPEILVRLRDGKVTIRPLAGTRRRGTTSEEDSQLEADLLADPKEIAEHLMLLDLGRNDVGRVAKPGTVTVTEKMIVERYSHVMHIVSNVEGEISGEFDAVSALFAGFPAGTLSGAPKVRAMEVIHELEPERRNLYGGTVGYFAANGTMDSCIVLRTGIVKDGMLHVHAGAGIVADSVAQREYQETVDKSQALIKAAQEAHRFTNIIVGN